MIEGTIPLSVGMTVFFVEVTDFCTNLDFAFNDYAYKIKGAQIVELNKNSNNMFRVLDGNTKKLKTRNETFLSYHDALCYLYHQREEKLGRMKDYIKELEEDSIRKRNPLPEWVKADLPIFYKDVFAKDENDYSYDLIRSITTSYSFDSCYIVYGYCQTFYVRVKDIQEDNTISKHFKVLTRKHFKSARDYQLAIDMLHLLKVCTGNKVQINQIIKKLVNGAYKK